jgi:RimJ/RimL family protein N-acetyltransferase
VSPDASDFGKAGSLRPLDCTGGAVAGTIARVGAHVIALPVPVPALSEAALMLRPWEQRDANVVLAAGLDELISRYRYSLPKSADAAATWIAATTSDRLAGVRLELAITEHGIPVGSAAVAELDHGNAMVRYWLLPEGRGRGLASTAVRLLADWTFSVLDLGRLAAFIEVDNLTSAAVLRRCGFVEEGRLRRHLTNHAGHRVDTLLYGLLPEDLPS